MKHTLHCPSPVKLPKLGKLAAVHDVRTLKLRNYLDMRALPPAPSSCTWSHAAGAFHMDGNDTVGDCTIAGAHHMIQTQRANSLQAALPITPQQVLAQYFKLTGNKDTGLPLLSVLKTWRNKGLFGGDKLGAFAAVDPNNLDEIRAAIYIFGGLYSGCELPIAWQGSTRWTLPPNLQGKNAPGSWGGHCPPLLDYDPTSFYACTWGGMMPTDPDAVPVFFGEQYVIINRDWIENTGNAPSGVDMAGLKADLALL